MPLDSMFTLGPFVVDNAGRLQPGEPDCFPVFSLVWRTRAVRVRMDRMEAGSEPHMGVLALQVVLGRVPSMAHPSGGIGPRDQAFSTLRGLSTLVPARWELGLRADHSLALETRVPIELPVTAVDLVSAVTVFLLELAPYLDVLDETGVAPPFAVAAGLAGTANTCPG